jgi:hypothetical protein
MVIRSHRLTVRTPGSHPGNPGSIPGEITIEDSSSSEWSSIAVMYLLSELIFSAPKWHGNHIEGHSLLQQRDRETLPEVALVGNLVTA